MEIAEKKYRDTPKKNRKYAKRLTDHINALLSKERIIEAKHYFNILYESKPNHIITIRLGYSLSIATFDNDGVRKFDSLLHDSNPSEIELCWFRLRYYVSANDRESCENNCNFLLSKTLPPEYLSTIIEACIHYGSYDIAESLVTYIQKRNLTLSHSADKRIKKIVRQRLVESFRVIARG